MSSSVRSAVVLAVLCQVLTHSALAEDVKTGRYTMHKVDDGFLRLDTQTGAVAYCKNNEDWMCKPVEDTTAEYREKIAQLEQESAGLQRKIKLLEELIVKRANEKEPAGLSGSGKGTSGLQLPSEQEIDEALDYFENLLRKFQDRLKRLEQGKSQEEGSAL